MNNEAIQPINTGLRVPVAKFKEPVVKNCFRRYLAVLLVRKNRKLNLENCYSLGSSKIWKAAAHMGPF